MATRYGAQFESLMAEVCREFGTRLVRSWDTSVNKEEVREFVNEAVKNFFKAAEPVSEVEVEERGGKKKAVESPTTDSEAEVIDSPPKKAPVKKSKGKGKGGKGLAKAVPASEIEPVVTKGKSKATKAKCQATTAKGTRCSKCALEGGVFCAVHLKSKEDKPKKKETSKKKEESEKKHTHGLMSPLKEGEECELCEMHGEAFDLPEYEMVSDNEAEDPNYELEEEDFDEID